MTPELAGLIARMQVALVTEGVMHSVHTKTQMDADQELITEAVTTAWDGLTPWEQRSVRHWRDRRRRAAAKNGGDLT